MSCEVVTVNDNGNVKYVAHIEPQINVSFDENTVLYSALNRCVKAFGTDVLDKLYTIEITSPNKRSDLFNSIYTYRLENVEN